MKKKISIILLIFMVIMSAIPFSSVYGAPPSELTFLLTPAYVYEGNSFSVTVQGGDVENVNITLYEDYPYVYRSYFTDEYGHATLVAPFVYLDTYFYTTASRNGAGPEDPDNFSYTNINVLGDADNLVIDAPSFVNEEEDFEVIVTANNHYPVENAMVTVGDSGTGAVMSFTNENGVASFIASKVDENTSIEILASKEGYYEDSDNILVINVPQQLEFQVLPETVNEGEIFFIRVVANGIGLKDVSIQGSWIYDWGSVYTNTTGWINIPAPYVDQNTQYTFIASKSGYLDAQATTTVIDDPLPELDIDVSTSFLEGEEITVSVTDSIIPIENVKVTVEWNDVFYYTDANGQVAFIVPFVNMDMNQYIRAEKDGYSSDSTIIIIINIVLPELVIIVPPSLIEGDTITVNVISDGNPVENVQIDIEWDENVYFTDGQGSVDITATEVGEDTEYVIIASKNEYQPDTVTIIILDKQNTIDTNGWLIGYISDITGMPLKGAYIYITPYNGENEPVLNYCRISDVQGRYAFEIKPGTYIMKIEMEGYQTIIEDTITIITNEVFDVNINLVESPLQEPHVSEDTSGTLIQNAIQNAIEAGGVGVKLSINETRNEVWLYSEFIIDIDPESQDNIEQIIKFDITAESDTPGTFVVVTYKHDQDIKDIQINYDGKIIKKMSLDDFLSPKNADNPEYVILETEDEFFFLVWVPSFSTHTITINALMGNVAEVVGPYTEITIAGAFIVIAIAAIVMFRKNEEE